MPKLSEISRRRLASCHPDLQRLVEEAIKEVEFFVVSGHRTKFEQEFCVSAGTSDIHWPKSRHNSLPSEAVDLAPWPIDWKDLKGFDELAAIVLKVAKRLGIDLVWGGHFTKPDRPHFELKRKQ